MGGDFLSVVGRNQMRTLRDPLLLGWLLGGFALMGTGCLDALGDFYLPLTDSKLAAGGTGGTGGSGGTGGAEPECAGDPSEANVIDACGVFVQADAVGATEEGTQARPYKSLQKALDNAGAKRVYACASAPYSETVTMAAPLTLYGGFECSKGWAWKADGRSALTGPAGAVALTLTKQADGARVQGFAITAAGATKKGESSIAVAVDDIAAELLRCEVTAGDGGMGEDGVTPAGMAMKGTDASPPDAGTMNACINPNALVGGAPGKQTCDDGATEGGLGGKGGVNAMMSDGSAGADGTLADAVKGKGGAGETTTDECVDGAKGKSGEGGKAGDAGALPGALSLAGISDTNLTDGKTGSRGGGGGGGGGAKFGAMLCAGSVDGNGASGGGGGAGGCGGKGGGGGKAGGSSIAIVSLGTKLVLTEVTLKTGKGGDGGKGSLGQAGGAYGKGGDGGVASGLAGSKAGCSGGAGSAGGDGGPGGGGRGGHSIGIAYASGPSKGLTLKGFTGDTVGAGGAAGPGNAAGVGSKGAASACWDFSQNKECLQ
jgi:hypothetical protein